MKMKNLLVAMLLAFPIYHETPYSKPLNMFDQQPNPYQRDCYVEQQNGAIAPCKF